jgi:hypothetical protein
VARGAYPPLQADTRPEIDPVEMAKCAAAVAVMAYVIMICPNV